MFKKKTEDTYPGSIIMTDETSLAILVEELRNNTTIRRSMETGILRPGKNPSYESNYWEHIPINKIVIMILEYLNLEIEAEKKIPMKLKEKEKGP